MNQSENNKRHRWQDDGRLIDGNDTYCYTCKDCGKKKIKVDAFTASYYDTAGIYISNKAPECQP